jgi:hypothetical protein
MFITLGGNEKFDKALIEKREGKGPLKIYS